jgi:hypothetical protein
MQLFVVVSALLALALATEPIVEADTDLVEQYSASLFLTPCHLLKKNTIIIIIISAPTRCLALPLS